MTQPTEPTQPEPSARVGTLLERECHLTIDAVNGRVHLDADQGWGSGTESLANWIATAMGNTQWTGRAEIRIVLGPADPRPKEATHAR